MLHCQWAKNTGTVETFKQPEDQRGQMSLETYRARVRKGFMSWARAVPSETAQCSSAQGWLQRCSNFPLGCLCWVFCKQKLFSGSNQPWLQARTCGCGQGRAEEPLTSPAHCASAPTQPRLHSVTFEAPSPPPCHSGSFCAQFPFISCSNVPPCSAPSPGQARLPAGITT